MSRLRLARIFWIGAAAVLVAAALVALAAVLRGDFSDNDDRILVTLGALLCAGGAALAGLALVDRGPARLLGWIVVGAAPVCFASIAWAVWSFAFEGEGNETADKLAWSAAIVARSRGGRAPAGAGTRGAAPAPRLARQAELFGDSGQAQLVTCGG